MKKLIISLFICILLITAVSAAASAAEIIIYAPTESEIMPTRDFYVVGKIDRKGQSASSMPLNITMELSDMQGNIVRSLKSNIGASGMTPAEYFLLDYEYGTPVNDQKGAGMNLFTPPDIMFDGNDRNSIRSTENKIVVKEDYFAAVFYGGATKEFELDYMDEEQKPYNDITEGTYKLTITATDLNSEEVCSKEAYITFGNEMGRVIASDNKLISQYAENNSLTLTNSVAGMWDPSEFFKVPMDFSYTISKRFLDNLSLEYGKAKDISIMLYNLDTENQSTLKKIGAAYSNPSRKSYLYYDIGENKIDFLFNGALLTKEGEIVSESENSFIKILRSETINENNTYLDFASNDGFVLTRGNKTVFYGVYSPQFKDSMNNDSVTPVDSTALLKYTVKDKDGKLLFEGYTNPFVIRGENTAPSRYEFQFEITPDSSLANSEASQLILSLCNSDKEEIFTEQPFSIKINLKGNFIGNYDNSYWGKSFCDAINALGQTPAEEALDPDEFITRGNFAAMINRLFGFSISSNETFADLDEKSIYYSDCSTAQAVGYMTGDEHGRVKADDYISREQAMIILARISEAEAGDKNVVFKDSDKVSFWAKSYVDIMTSNGIVSGFDGYLNPIDSITVAEATALIIKTFKWMYAGEIKNSDIDTTIQDDTLTNVEISDTEFIAEVNFDTLSAFVSANSDTLYLLSEHLMKNYGDGIYISRVGNGLEVRDYLMGNYIALSNEALNITTAFSNKFAEFSIRYNPRSENAIHFVLGRNEEGKQIGLTFTSLKEVKNKTLTHIEGNWHYYIQK